MNSTTDLNTYYRWARQCVCAFAPKRKIQAMLNNQDSLAEIVNKLINADLKWNGMGSKTGYRKAQGKYAVMRIAYRTSKNAKPLFSLDSHGMDTNKYDFIPDTKSVQSDISMMQKENMDEVIKLMDSHLTVKQRRVIKDYYLNGKTLKEIGPSRQAAHQLLSKAVAKLRKMVNNE